MANTILLIVAVAMIALSILAFAAGGSVGVLMTLFAKPFIDASWSVASGELNAGRVFGVVAPVLILSAIFARKRVSNVPLLGIWFVYVGYAVLPAMFDLLDKGLITMAQNFFRTVSGLAGFLMLQTYFSTKAEFRKLLLVLMLAGLFPIGVGLYQAVTGVIWREHITVGLMRHTGFYHDVSTVRIYVFQTLTALILYWCYFKPAELRVVKGILVLAFAGLCAVVLFKTYSKAAFLSALVWVVIWGWGRRQILPVIVVGSALVLANFFIYDKLWTDTEQLFSKETEAFIEGDGGSSEEARQRSLAGRWITWELFWSEYKDRSALEQILGAGGGGAAHNDYLSALVQGGVVGLTIYLTLLLAIGMRIFQVYRRDRSPLNVMAVMLFAMWMIDTIGLVPRLYPGYQWYVWGFIGLALKGINWGGAAARPSAAQNSAEGPVREAPLAPANTHRRVHPYARRSAGRTTRRAE